MSCKPVTAWESGAVVIILVGVFLDWAMVLEPELKL